MFEKKKIIMKKSSNNRTLEVMRKTQIYDSEYFTYSNKHPDLLLFYIIGCLLENKT